MVKTRNSDQQRSKSRQKVIRLYKQWHRLIISKRFIKPPYSISRAVVVVDDDSHFQRIVLATEEATVTQQASHRPTYQIPIPLVVTKRYGEGQRVTSWWQPATQTNRDPNRDKKLYGSTSNGTHQYQNGSSNLLTPYREQPRSTRNVVAHPRPAFSAKKRKNYTPTSFFLSTSSSFSRPNIVQK